MDIIKGHIYRAKKPKRARSIAGDFFNDRSVLYVSEHSVQYDSPTLGFGRRYPTISREKFEAWAGSDVTEGYPEGEWAR